MTFMDISQWFFGRSQISTLSLTPAEPSMALVGCRLVRSASPSRRKPGRSSVGIDLDRGDALDRRNDRIARGAERRGSQILHKHLIAGLAAKQEGSRGLGRLQLLFR